MQHWKSAVLREVINSNLPTERGSAFMAIIFLAGLSLAALIGWGVRAYNRKDLVTLALGLIVSLLIGLTTYEVCSYKAAAQKSLWSYEVGALAWRISEVVEKPEGCKALRTTMEEALANDTRISFDVLLSINAKLSTNQARSSNSPARLRP